MHLPLVQVDDPLGGPGEGHVLGIQRGQAIKYKAEGGVFVQAGPMGGDVGVGSGSAVGADEGSLSRDTAGACAIGLGRGVIIKKGLGEGEVAKVELRGDGASAMLSVAKVLAVPNW
ncbi:MAG: hypothetical protein HC898_03745 [Phycisphaerales bacterium]|nr:hypothetical protein [Phycisphaerales bacterium]